MKTRPAPLYTTVLNNLPRIAVALVLFAFVIAAAGWGQSQIPAGSGNYLMTASSPALGDRDGVTVVFYEIPDTVTGTIYFGIFDAGNDDDDDQLIAPFDADQRGANSRTTYYLVGGNGALTDPASDSLLFDGEDLYGSGALPNAPIASYSVDDGGSSGFDDEQWYYFASTDVSAGEHIGNKYYFRIVVVEDTSLGGNKNAFKLDVSYDGTNNTDPTQISGATSFSYVWTIGVRNRPGQVWNLYPFIPEGSEGSEVTSYNYDADMDRGPNFSSWRLYTDAGQTNQITVTAVSDGARAISDTWLDDLAGAADPTSFASDDDEPRQIELDVPIGKDNKTWELRIDENDDDQALNPLEVWFTDITGNQLRIYAADYAPAAPYKIVANVEDGSGISDNTDTELVSFQVVDIDDNPIPYPLILRLDVTTGNFASISNDAAGSFLPGATTAYLQTDNSGLAWARVRSAAPGAANITITTDGSGTPATEVLSGTNDSPSITFAANIPVSMDSVDLVAEVGTAPNPIAIEINTNNDVLSVDKLILWMDAALIGNIQFAAQPDLTFSDGIAPMDENILILDDSLADVTTSFIAANTTRAAAADSFAINLNVTPIPPNHTIYISGIQLTAPTGAASGSLELDYNGTVATDIVDSKTITIQTNDPVSIWTNGAGNQNWNDGANWSTNPLPPQPGDDVIIPGGLGSGNYPLVNAAGISINDLTVANDAELTLQGNAITITGTATNNGTVHSTGNAAASIDFDSNTGMVEYTAGNTMNITTGGTQNYADLAISGGSLNIPSILTVSNDLSIGVGATLNLNGNDLTVAGNFDLAGTLVSTGVETVSDLDTNTGTVEFAAPGGPPNITTGGSHSYQDVDFSGGTYTSNAVTTVNGDFTLSGADLTLGGNLSLPAAVTLSGGSLDTGANTLTIQTADWDDSAMTFTPAAGTVRLSATNPTITTGAANYFFNLIIDDSASMAVGSDLDVDGSLTVTAGTLTTGANVLDVAAAAVVNGILDASGQLVADSTTIGGNLSGTGSASFGAGAVDINGDVTIGGAFSDASSTTAVGGNFTPAAYTENGGTITFDTGAANVGGYSFRNVVVSANTNQSGDWTVLGSLTVSAGTLTTGTNVLNVTGNTDVSGTLNATGQAGGDPTTIGGNLSGTGSASFGAGAVGITGNAAVATFAGGAGAVTVGGNVSSATSFTAGAGTVDIAGDVTAVAVNAANGGTIQVGGDFTPTAFTANNDLVVLDTAAASDVGGYTFFDLEIAKGAATLTSLAALTVTNSLTMTSGIWAPAGFTHQIAGDWNDSGITFQPGAGTIQLTGANPNVTTGAGNYFFNLTVNNGASQQSDLDVNGALTVTAGTLTTGANVLDVAAAAVVNGILDATGQAGGDPTNIGGNLSGTGSASFGAGAVGISGNAAVATFAGGAGAVTVGGNVSSATSFTAGAGTVDIAGDVTAVAVNAANGGTIQVGGDFTPTAFTANNDLVVLDTAAASDVGGYTFFDLEIAKGAATLTSLAALTVTNSLTMTSGIWAPAGFTHQIAGDWNDSSITFQPGAGTIQLTGANPNVTTGAGNYFFNLTVNNGASQQSDLDVNGALTVTAGTLTTGANVLDVAAAAVVNGILDASGQLVADSTTIGGNLSGTGSASFGAGAVDINGDVTIGGTFSDAISTTAVGGNFTPAAYTENGGTITFDTGAANVGGYTFRNVVVSANKNQSGDWTVLGSLTISAGTLATGTNVLNVTGNSDVSGTLNATGQAGGDPTTIGGNLSGTGSASFGAGAVGITGNVSVATFTAGAGAVDINGDVTSGTAFTASMAITNIAGATVTFTGFSANGGELIFDRAGAQAVTSAGNYNDLTINAPTTVNLQNDMTVVGTLTINGALNLGAFTLTISSTTDLSGVDFTSGTIAIAGAVDLTSNGSELYDLLILGTGTLTPQDPITVRRHVTVNAGGSYVENGQILTLGGASGVIGDITDSNVVPEDFGSVIVSTVAKTMLSNVAMSSLDIQSGSLNVGNNTLTVTGNIAITGTLNNNDALGSTSDIGGTLTVTGILNNGTAASTVTVDGDVDFTGGSYVNGGLLQFAGGIAQQLTSNTENLGTAEIVGAGTNVQLQDPTTFGDLVITSGQLTTGDNGLTAASLDSDGTFTAAAQTGASSVTVNGNLSGTGSVVFGGGAVQINGDVTVLTFTGGTGAVDINTTTTLNVGTTFTESSTTTNIDATTVTFGAFIANGGTVVFDRAAATALTSNGAYNDVTVALGTTLNQQNPMSIGNDLLVSGTHNAIANNLDVTGNLTTTGSLSSTGGAMTIGGNLNHTSGTVSLQGTLDVTGDLTQANGSGLFQVENTVDLGAGTYSFNANVALVGALTLTTGGNLTFGNGAGDTLIISGGAIGITDGAASVDLTINSQLSGAQNLTLNFDGTTSLNNSVNIGAAAGTALTIASAGDTTFTNNVLLSNSAAGSLSVTGAGNIRFQGTLDAGNGLLQANGLAGTLRFDGNVTITGAAVATNLQSDVQLDQLTFASAGDITFGNAVTDLLRLSTGAVIVNALPANADVVINSDLWSDGTPRNFTVNTGADVITVNGDLGSIAPGDELAQIDFDAGTVNLAAATVNSTGLQTYNATVQMNISSGTNTGGSTISFTAPNIDMDSGSINSSGDITFATTGRTYVTLGADATFDAGGMGNDVTFNDVFINIDDGFTLFLADVGTVSTDNFYFFGGGIDLITSATNHTDLSVNGDFVALGYANADSVEDPHRGAANNTLWAYPGLAAITALQGPSYALTNFAELGDANGGVAITVTGDFYVNNVDMGGTGDWSLSLPENINPVAAPNPDVTTNDPDTNTDWGSPYAVSINADYTNARVLSNTVIAANISTVADASVAALNGTTDVFGYVYPAAAPDYDPDTRLFSNFATVGNALAGTDSISYGLGAGDMVVTYGFDNQRTKISEVHLVKDDVAMIRFNRPILNSGNEIEEALTAGYFTINGEDVEDQAYLAPFWSGSTALGRYNDPDAETEPQIPISSANFEVIDTIFIRLEPDGLPDSWPTDAEGADGTGAGTGTDSEGLSGANVINAAIRIEFAKGLFRGTNAADMVYADDDDGSFNIYEGAQDKTGPVLYSAEIGRMRDSGDWMDGHNFLTLRYSEDVVLSTQAATAAIPAGNTRATTDFDGAVGNIGGEFENASYDVLAFGTATEAVHVDGYLYYTNTAYAAGTDPPFVTGSRDSNPGNALDAPDNRTVRIVLSGYYNGSAWEGWHFLVPDPYSPGTGLEVQQNNFITDASANTNFIDALESTRSMMETLNTVNRPYRVNPNPPAPDVSILTAATNTPFDSHSYTAGVDFDFWDVSAPVISAFSSTDDVLSAPLRQWSVPFYEIVLVENPATQLIESFDFFIQDNGLSPTGAFQISEDNLNADGIWEPDMDAHDIGVPGPPYSDRPYFDASGGGIIDGDTYRGIRDSAATYSGNNTDSTQAFYIGRREQPFASALNANTLLGEYRTDEPENFLFRQDASQIAISDDPYFRLFLGDSASAGWDNLSELYVVYDHTQNGYYTDLAGNLMPSTLPSVMNSVFGAAYENYAINPYPEAGGTAELGKLLAIERTPPEIRLALAAVGGTRVFIRFSEPVWALDDLSLSLPTESTANNLDLYFDIPGKTVTAFSPDYIRTNQDFGIDGFVEGYIEFTPALTADEALNLTLDITAPIYDKATNQPNVVSRPMTDVGIGIISPVWATDGIQQDGTRGGGFTTLRVFDGSSGLDDLDITIESSITAPSFLGLPVNLFFDVNVPAGTKSATETGSTSEFWSPIGITGLISNPNTSARIATRTAWDPVTGIAQHLIPAGDPEVERGSMLEFFYRVGPIMAATVDDPNEPLLLKPWKIDLGAIEVQRGGVTILNNVINPENGDETILNYVLERQGMVIINVFTLDGDLVRVLQRGRQGSGTYNLGWDGRNSNGDIVARGFYFVRIVAPGVDEVRKVLVVR
jgi:hypothetical protein